MLSTIRTFVLNELTLQKRVFFFKYAQKYWGNNKYSLQILLGKICLFFGRLASHDFMWKKEDKVGNKTGYKKGRNGKGKKKRGKKKDQNNFGKKSKGCLICMCKPKSYLITSNYQQSLHFLPILMLSNWLKLFHKKRISINWICFLCYSLADAKGLSLQHHILQTFFYITLVLIRRNSLKSQHNFFFLQSTVIVTAIKFKFGCGLIQFKNVHCCYAWMKIIYFLTYVTLFTWKGGLLCVIECW